MRANSSKAREKVDSCGTCRASFQPQIRRNCASRARASSNCLVVPNPYTALATKALAIASLSFEGRPTQPRLLGTKRARGIISKVATKRFAGSVNSPSSSFKTGKSPVCSTWANCVICCRRVSFIWAPEALPCVATTAYFELGHLFKQNRTVLFYFSGLTQFCKRLFVERLAKLAIESGLGSRGCGQRPVFWRTNCSTDFGCAPKT